MDKRYQVFISSTFLDLQDERKAVMHALQKAGYFVAGMELFPSDDADSWEVIQRVIDQSDYYVLVIAGRYGSLAKGKRVSFTELEYSYAKQKKIPVLAFIHGDRKSLPSGNVDTDSKMISKLDKFRAKVESAHNRTLWTSQHDLAASVLASLSQKVNLRPAVGWVRGDAASANEELRLRVDALQARYDRVLQERDAYAEQLEALGASANGPAFAWGDDTVALTFAIPAKNSDTVEEHFQVTISWELIFETVAPAMIGWTAAGNVSLALTRFCAIAFQTESRKDASLTKESLLCVRDQLIALGMISVREEDRRVTSRAGYTFGALRKEEWKLTDKGMYEMASKRAQLRREADQE